MDTPTIISDIRRAAGLAIPTSGMYILLMLSELISLYFIGRLPGSNSEEISAFGLGNLVYNCAALAVGFGFTSSQDALVTQAYGRGNIELCKLYLNRCQLWMLVVFLISGSVVYSTETILLNFDITDREIASHAGIYTRWCTAGLLGTFQYSALRKYTMAIKRPSGGLVVQGISTSLHVMWCLLLVPKYRIWGVGVAMAIKGWTDFIVLVLYVRFVIKPRNYGSGWWRVSRVFQNGRVFAGMVDYLKLAIPSVLSLVVEWWAWEFLALLTAKLHDKNLLAAHVTGANIGSLLYLVGTGGNRAASTLVGNACGGRNRNDVGRLVKAVLLLNCVLCGSVSILAIVFRRRLAAVYTPKQPIVQDILAGLVPFIGIGTFIDGITQAVQGSLYGMGLQAKVSKVGITCFWLLLLPLAWFLAYPQKLKLKGIWIACNSSSAVAFFSIVILFLKTDLDAVIEASDLRMSLDSGSVQVDSETVQGTPQGPVSNDLKVGDTDASTTLPPSSRNTDFPSV